MSQVSLLINENEDEIAVQNNNNITVQEVFRQASTILITKIAIA